jgi:hypothetical protein
VKHHSPAAPLNWCVYVKRHSPAVPRCAGVKRHCLDARLNWGVHQKHTCLAAPLNWCVDVQCHCTAAAPLNLRGCVKRHRPVVPLSCCGTGNSAPAS